MRTASNRHQVIAAHATLIVRTISARARVGLLQVGSMRFRCALGRTGSKIGKREGDGASPIGTWALREAYYRADRIARPRTDLKLRAIDRRDGWCDATRDRNYNRRVSHPYPASAEHLWREDGLYDIVVVLGYNDAPRIKGRGSAIFLHCAREGFSPTQGCVALARRDLIRLMASLGSRTRLQIA
ncbi:MAG: L,D-transpeptidase family protein [Hyphomicrobiaceae bacterium]